MILLKGVEEDRDCWLQQGISKTSCYVVVAKYIEAIEFWELLKRGDLDAKEMISAPTSSKKDCWRLAKFE